MKKSSETSAESEMGRLLETMAPVFHSINQPSETIEVSETDLHEITDLLHMEKVLQSRYVYSLEDMMSSHSALVDTYHRKTNSFQSLISQRVQHASGTPSTTASASASASVSNSVSVSVSASASASVRSPKETDPKLNIIANMNEIRLEGLSFSNSTAHVPEKPSRTFSNSNSNSNNNNNNNNNTNHIAVVSSKESLAES